jgi:signal transduction histidine kinase
MLGIIGISTTSLYFFIIHSLNQEFNRELLTLVEAATPSLNMVKTLGLQSLDRNLGWRELFSKQKQSLEWFDSEGKLLGREGTTFPSLSPTKNVLSSLKVTSKPFFQEEGQIRSITISVYSNDSDDKNLQLKGYLRASESTEEIQITIRKLRLGLELGGITTLILISISSIYVTRQAIEPIRQSFERFKQFSAEISHQIRTPLTRISLAIEILLTHNEKFSPADAQKLIMINASTEQIKSLVEDLLFLMRTDGISVLRERQFSNISLNLLLQTLIEQLEPIARCKEINFQTQLHEDVLVRGESEKLNRLFFHILKKIINDADSGASVYLSIERSRLASATARCGISVTPKLQQTVIVSIGQTGIDLAPRELPDIFQRYWQNESILNRQQKGLGLGLTVAQAIVKQHGGKITVSSQMGVGTCFRVYLPTSS